MFEALEAFIIGLEPALLPIAKELVSDLVEDLRAKRDTSASLRKAEANAARAAIGVKTK